MKRICPICEKEMTIENFYYYSDLNYECIELDKLWNSKYVQIMCCDCTYIVKRLILNTIEGYSILDTLEKYNKHKHWEIELIKKNLRKYRLI